MVDYIHKNKDRYGVEAICRILPIAGSTYYRTLDLTVNPEHRAKRDLKSGNRLKLQSVKFYKSLQHHIDLYCYG